ncbi:hypothetical protein I3F58_25710 [Streptomyces sp. MUM 203J]|uniref:hypothetical protein n=1 Tax=Streptomyces sp. MUM 203J TaxID=2791990 RepID=UPI001F046C50|nr:hypothetical protein [Streptomyces sp. MUM 203J]MCH0542893.1 hypothetical protein [Streptomyces sp. MUM 203J]
MHHHGYAWLGSGLHQVRDGVRRAGHPEFATSPVPPLELAHWLLRPAPFVRGTWDDPEQAAEWFGRQVRPHRDVLADAHDREVLEARLAAVSDSAAGGEDVAGGWWLSGQRYLGVYLVGCRPHRFRPEYPCPTAGPALP